MIIVGTTKTRNLESNTGSIRVKLGKDDIKEISDLVQSEDVAGDRIDDVFIRCSWKYANTPLKS